MHETIGVMYVAQFLTLKNSNKVKKKEKVILEVHKSLISQNKYQRILFPRFKINR